MDAIANIVEVDAVTTCMGIFNILQLADWCYEMQQFSRRLLLSTKACASVERSTSQLQALNSSSWVVSVA